MARKRPVVSSKYGLMLLMLFLVLGALPTASSIVFQRRGVTTFQVRWGWIGTFPSYVDGHTYYSFYLYFPIAAWLVLPTSYHSLLFFQRLVASAWVAFLVSHLG